MSRATRILASAICGLALVLAGTAHAVVSYDQSVTSNILFGAGNANGSFTVDRANGVELGLRGKVRFPTPLNQYNSNGDGTYTFKAGVFSGSENPQWNFEWSVNTNYEGSGGNLSGYTFLLELDFDPGAGTDFLAWDHISAPVEDVPHIPPSPVPFGFYDHSMGDNVTPNGGGTEAVSAANYATLLAGNHVAQNSWRYTFYDGPGFTFDANATGTYDIRLTAFQGVTQVAQVTIKILVDGFVTPDVINGSGNANGSYTLDRANGVELGLRGKQRFPAANIFNSNYDGTYTFLAGVFNGVENPQWNFEWSINTDYTGLTGKKLDDYTYLLEMDFDPGAGTNFLAWDHVTFPVANIPHVPPSAQPGGYYDHSMGDNSFLNGTGVEANSQASYASQLATYNVAQNSWRYTFYDGPGYVFDATKIGRYDLRLTAFDGLSVAAQVAAQIKVVKVPSCTTNAQCDDGLACNGAETCNLATSECEFGTEVVCNGQCETGVCNEPTGTCQPVANGTICNGAPDSCSLDDTCQAGTCVDGGSGDVDLDGICGADDNCPADANPAQADLDGDGDGDACDASDAALNVTRARAKRNSSLNPLRPNGLVKVSGDLIIDLPGGDVLSSANGVAIRVADALNLDTDDLPVAPAWTNAQCAVKLHPLNGVVRTMQCKSPDKNYVAIFRAVNPVLATEPQVYKFTVTLRRVAIAGPFNAPVSGVLSQGAVDRTGTISDCQSNAAGLSCKEG